MTSSLLSVCIQGNWVNVGQFRSQSCVLVKKTKIMTILIVKAIRPSDVAVHVSSLVVKGKKVKVKLSLCFNWAPRHEGTRWRWVVSFTPWRLYPQGKSPWYPLDRRREKQENSVPLGMTCNGKAYCGSVCVVPVLNEVPRHEELSTA
jgi:hypothetical protein